MCCSSALMYGEEGNVQFSLGPTIMQEAKQKSEIVYTHGVISA